MNDLVTYLLTPNTLKDSAFPLNYNDLDREDVIPQREKHRLIDVEGKQATRLFLEKRKRFMMIVTCSSIYTEEWTVQYGPFENVANRQ